MESRPPARTRSAAPRRSNSTPSPIAIAPDAQAAETVIDGPVKPNLSESCAAAAPGMIIGSASGCRPRTPPSINRACCVLEGRAGAEAHPGHDGAPIRGRPWPGRGVQASWAAPTASCTERSSRRACAGDR